MNIAWFFLILVLFFRGFFIFLPISSLDNLLFQNLKNFWRNFAVNCSAAAAAVLLWWGKKSYSGAEWNCGRGDGERGGKVENKLFWSKHDSDLALGRDPRDNTWWNDAD